MVRAAREPILAQLRLAWWRERLAEDPARWPRGEPLLALLHDTGLVGLGTLVDGWEALLGDVPLRGGAHEAWLGGRVAAVAALGDHPGAGAMARGWGLGDLAGRAAHPEDQAVVAALVAWHDWRRLPLPRRLRPLLVLHHFARRAAHRQGGGLFGAVRLGLIGR